MLAFMIDKEMKAISTHSRRIVSAALALAALAIAVRLHAQALQPIVTDTAFVKTSVGTITLALYGEDAPRTVANFIGLAAKGFYKGLLFHRVLPGFVVQAGDPKTKDTSLRGVWGTGGESIYGRPFEDELNPNAPSYKRGYVEGTLAMANRGPNTNTSQFFITLKDVALPKNYTIFGRLLSGMDVVRAIEAGELRDRRLGVPAKPVSIVEVRTVPARR